MAPTVEELVKASTLLTPPKKDETLTKGFSVSKYQGFAAPKYRNPFAENLSMKLPPPLWAGITPLSDAHKALVDSYKVLTSARQALDTFKPSPIAKVLVEGFHKNRREAVERVLEALRPKVNVFATLAESTALVLTNVQEGLKRRAQREALVGELLFSAYQAREELGRGRPERMMRFLNHELGTRRPNFDHVTALWEILAGDHDDLLDELLSADDPRAYLASRVAFRIRGMKTECPLQDTFSRATDEEPLAPREVHELTERNLVGKKSQVPPDFGAPRVRPTKNGMKPLSKDDPFLLVPAWHGDERQTLEEIARYGRARSRSRARGVIEYHDRLRWGAESFDRGELLEIVGGENGLRALREAAKNRLTAVRESRSQKKL